MALGTAADVCDCFVEARYVLCNAFAGVGYRYVPLQDFAAVGKDGPSTYAVGSMVVCACVPGRLAQSMQWLFRALALFSIEWLC